MFITKCVRQVLQNVIEVYYKVRQVLRSVTDCYYKVHQVLQSVAVITKLDSYCKVRRNKATILLSSIIE